MQSEEGEALLIGPGPFEVLVDRAGALWFERMARRGHLILKRGKE